MNARDVAFERAAIRADAKGARRRNPVGKLAGGSSLPSMGVSQFRGGGGDSDSDSCSSSGSDEEMSGGSLMLGQDGHGQQRSAPMLGQDGHGQRAVGAGRKRRSKGRTMGMKLSRHIQALHGRGFWSDFADGFMSVVRPVAGVAKSLLPMLGPEGAAASGVMGAVGLGHGECDEGLESSGEHLEGGGFMDWVNKLAPIARAAAPAIGSLVGHPNAGQGVADVLGLFGHGNVSKTGATEGSGRRRRAPAGPNDGRRKRADIVKKVMAEKGMKMIEASKYVKAHGLY